jgi:cytochrome c oxidase subunit III
MNRASLAALAGARPVSFQPGEAGWRGGGGAHYSAAQIGLWVFMGVVCSLFVLFSVAYMMRIGYGDWRPAPTVPWQLWLSTALLGVGGVGWHMAARAAAMRTSTGVATAANGGAAGVPGNARTLRWCALAWISAVGFLASQLGAWQALTVQQYLPAASPGAGFFYMLTGLHGLHVLGGMVAAALVTARLWRRGIDSRSRAGLALCAQYWHLLLAVWLALFGLLFTVTPELVQAVCASVGIGAR